LSAAVGHCWLFRHHLAAQHPDEVLRTLQGLSPKYVLVAPARLPVSFATGESLRHIASRLFTRYDILLTITGIARSLPLGG